ncbi:MAG: DUF5661 family protein [Dehalococcoidia bacterium]|jgi:hypothetical protein
MKVFDKIGSSERLLDIFQKVNKIRLDEAVVQNYSKTGVLDVAFNDLKNGVLNIEQSNTQTDNDQTFVEITAIDKQNDNLTFTFKANLSEGDQDGVFSVNEVALISFTFDAADGSETVELTENDLRRFNMQHKNELFDIVQKYIDAEEGAPEEMDEIYEEAAKKIDSYPFGAKDREGMVKPIQYADEKPTNPKLRVDAEELKKIVNESTYSPETRNNLVNYFANTWSKDPTAQAVQGRHPELAKYFKYTADDFNKLPDEELKQIWDKSEEIANNPMTENILNVGKTADTIVNKAHQGHYRSLSPQGKQGYINAAIEAISSELTPEQFYSMDSETYTEMIAKVANAMFVAYMSKMNEQDDEDDIQVADDNLNLPPEEVGDEGGEDAGKYVNFVNKFKQKNAPEEVPGIDDPLPVDTEPTEEIPEEKRQIINQAYDNLIASGVQTPTMEQIKGEINKLTGVQPPAKSRVHPAWADDYLGEGEEKSDYPKELGKEFSPEKQYNKKQKKYSKKIKIKEEEDPEIARKNIQTASKYDEMPSPQTTVKSLRQQVDDLAKQKSKGLMEDGDESENNDDVETPEPIDGVTPEQPENDIENPSMDDEQPSEEQQSDDIAQMATDKEAAGEQIPGGKAEGKSPLEFNLDQLAMGVDVEMEHTDDPMKAFEIAMDHLAEFPDYYTRLKQMEDQAKSEKGGGEGDSEEKPTDGEDKEMTNMLLGFKPKNVGDEIDGGEEEEPEKMDEMAAGNMKTKVFKIGEYAKGGIIKLVISGRAIQIEALDWNTKQPIESKSFMIDEPNAGMEIDNFLNDLTSSYYASKIMEWIETNA